MTKDQLSDKELLIAVAKEIDMPPAPRAISGKRATSFDIQAMADLIGTSYLTVYRVMKYDANLNPTMRRFIQTFIILKRVRDRKRPTNEDRIIAKELLMPLDEALSRREEAWKAAIKAAEPLAPLDDSVKDIQDRE